MDFMLPLLSVAAGGPLHYARSKGPTDQISTCLLSQVKYRCRR